MGREESVLSYKLNTGALMPSVALGTAAVKESPEETRAYILKALELGYRHFDTAALYKSEASLGGALNHAFSAGIVKREELFVTTKIWLDDLHPPDILPALRSSLSALQLDYVDLYLVHWPLRLRKGSNLFQLKEEDFLPWDLQGCWKVLEQGVELGLAKAIGVSNFSIKRFKEMEPQAKIIPAVNQIEMHPGCDQEKVREYCKRKGIQVTAWSPLGAPGYGPMWGSNAVIDNPVMKEIAEKHGKSVAQVALRWGLDNGVGLVVKSSNPERMAQNLDLFDWTLTEEDHEKIKSVPPNRVWGDGSQFCNATTSPYKSTEDLWDNSE